MPDAALRHISKSEFKRGIARVVRWFDNGARGLWAEARWPGRRKVGGVVLHVVLPERGSLKLGWSLEWTMRLADTIDALAASPFRRPVRLHISSPETDPNPILRRAWTGGARDAAVIEVDFSVSRISQVSASVRAYGLVGDVLAAAIGDRASHISHIPLTHTSVAIEGSDAVSDLGPAVTSTMIWWAVAGLDDSYRLFEWLQEAVPTSVRTLAQAHPARRTGELSDAAIGAYTLEARLEGMWQLVAHFEPRAVGEEEIAGWVREIEAAYRYTLPTIRKSPHRKRARPTRSSIDALPSPGFVWVPSAGHRPALGSGGERSWERRRRRGLVLPAPHDIFDGERTLVEGIHLMCVRWGFDGPSAARIARRWIKEGLIQPLDDRGSDRRTVMYFSFGSCMCLQSFRETVPRYDLLGPARLYGHRLAFTFESVGRNGGVADVVSDARSDVWGVLYRIPRAYVPRLDAREGVHLGHYQQSWIEVEALGVTWQRVLTYTVANKARSEIRPSDEYAGLIMEGAQTMLHPDYCRRLADLFAGMGVEPSLPL